MRIRGMWNALLRSLTRSARVAIVGCAPRTGSTLLTRILDSHSRIASPCELGLPRYFPLEDEKRALVIEKMAQISRYYGIETEPAAISTGRLASAVLRKERKDLLVLKDPRQSLYLAAFGRENPLSRVVHLVRDARSVAANRMFSADRSLGLERWLEYNEAVVRARDRLRTSRSIVVRYEDLTSDPVSAVTRVVAFLGFRFEAPMLEYGRFPHADDQMLLWAGRPGESPLQQTLSEGAIRRVRFDERIRHDVENLYESMVDVRRLNEAFGYGPWE